MVLSIWQIFIYCLVVGQCIPLIAILHCCHAFCLLHCRISGKIEPSCFETVKKVALTGQVCVH